MLERMNSLLGVCQGQETGAYMWSYLGWCGRLAHTIEFSDFFFLLEFKTIRTPQYWLVFPFNLDTAYKVETLY